MKTFSEQIIKKSRLICKALLYLLCVIFFFLVNSIIYFLVPGKKNKLYLSTKATTYIVRMSIFVLGVHVTVEDEKNFRAGKNFLAVSNHVSYLDIYSIASIMNSVFVASVDGVEKDLLMGTATRLSGGLFVERKNRSRVREDMNTIKEVLDLGYNVVLFPEAGTSNGDRVLPFRSSLFESAINAKADVVTMSINYTGLNGEPVTKENRDNVYYYEHLQFFPHFFNLLEQKSVHSISNIFQKLSLIPAEAAKSFAVWPMMKFLLHLRKCRIYYHFSELFRFYCI